MTERRSERHTKANLVVCFTPFLPPANRFSMDDVRMKEFVGYCMRHIFGYENVKVKLLAYGVSCGINEDPRDAEETVYEFKVPDMTIEQVREVHSWMDRNRGLLQEVGQPGTLYYHAYYGPEPV